jgi:phospho-N-acetylmuramoyl-pentapeptide-transferase
LAGSRIEKAGTPTMGGLIIIFATLVPVLLFAKLHTTFTLSCTVVTTLWMGTNWFIDDYIHFQEDKKYGLKEYSEWWSDKLVTGYNCRYRSLF